MKKLFKEVNKIYSISHEILKAEHEYKDKIKNLTDQDKELLRGFEGSMRVIIDQLNLTKTALFIMIKN